MYGILWMLSFTLALTDRSEAVKESNRKCDVIYRTMLNVRKNIFKNPSLVRLISDELEKGKTVFETTVGVKVEDTAALRVLACNIAGATSLSELSDAINVPNLHDIKVGNQSLFADAIEKAGTVPTELRKVRYWVKKSGFPGNWPLTVSFAVTRKFMRRTPLIGRYIAPVCAHQKTDDEIASIITNPTITSLQDYWKRLCPRGKVAEASNPKLIPAYKSFGNKAAVNDYIRAVNTFKAALKALLQMDLRYLWKEENKK